MRKKLKDSELLVGGADISYNRGSEILYAAIVILRLKDLLFVETVGHRAQTSFPYIPGLLSFREVPVLLETFKKLRHKPDLLLCDGQGIAHPRRFGLASHLGLLLDRPTIGCAKSRLIGTAPEPSSRRGSATTLKDKGEAIGKVLRTRDRVRPVYVSIGHKIDLDTAVSVVLRCSPRYRIPEPTRQAHHEVNRIREHLSRS